MTPAEGRAEWAKWAARADELRRTGKRLREMAAECSKGSTIRLDINNAATFTGLAESEVRERLDALREFAPKETTT